MGSIIIALPRIEDAKKIGSIVRKRGIEYAGLYTTGSQILSAVHALDYGIVISGRRFKDMHYTRIAEYLPERFELLVLSSAELEHYSERVQRLDLPIRPSDMVNQIEAVMQRLDGQYRKKRVVNKRSERDQNYIINAKRVLMELNNMTEQEAYRYIQKCSMDSGTNMVETAQMILLMNVVNNTDL